MGAITRTSRETERVVPDALLEVSNQEGTRRLLAFADERGGAGIHGLPVSGRSAPMRRLLAVGAVVVGGVIAARRFLPFEGSGPDRYHGPTMRQRLMARMMEGLPPDSPPKLIMSILPRLREQNDEIIALLREQNEVLRRGRPEPANREKQRPG